MKIIRKKLIIYLLPLYFLEDCLNLTKSISYGHTCIIQDFASSLTTLPFTVEPAVLYSDEPFKNAQE
jgi:hypothetical protein